MTMARDVTRSDIRRAIERLEGRADRVQGGGKSTEDAGPPTSNRTADMLADMSTTRIAKLVAVERNFDDTDPGDPDRSTPGVVSKETSVPLTPYSCARADDVDGPDDFLSDADAARLEVLTGGGEWIDATSDDMAAARQIEDEL